MYTRVVFAGAHEALVIDDSDIAHINEGQILGKVLMSTVCGSDVHTVKGSRNEPVPSVLGHEGVVEVVECKRANSQCAPGDRITFSIIDCCGQCTRCEAGVAQKCFHLAKYGHLQLSYKSGWTGCYASHIVLDSNTAVFKVDPEIPLSVIAPINCALATMVNALSNISTPRGSRILVQGAGLLGVYGCALLSERGCSVFCSDISDERLSTVRKFGATAVKDTSELESESMDAVIEVCGHAGVITEGYRCVRPGGSYVLVGLVHPNSALPITAEHIIRKCLTVVGVHNYRPVHLEQSVEFISRAYKSFPFEELVSPPIPLTEAQQAFQLAEKQTYHRVALSHFITNEYSK